MPRCSLPQALDPKRDKPACPVRSPQRVRLDVYDLKGRKVAALVSGELGSGPHAVAWDGADLQGRACSSGTYMARLVTENEIRTSKLMLTR